MKANREFWLDRLQIVKRTWHALRPEDSTSEEDAGETGLLLESTRILAQGMTFESSVSIWRTHDAPWSIQVRGILDDHRVTALTSFVEERDASGMCVITFDVDTAYNFLERREEPALPPTVFEATDKELNGHLETFSHKIDHIWSIFGGYSLGGFEALAIWAMVHRARIGGGRSDIAMACAAFLYGDKALSLELLADFQEHWKARARAWAGDPQTEEGFAIIKGDIAKLRAIVEQNQQWRH